ncbi:MAG: hypothetical protein RLZZ70_625, partial [Candidatus Parcubacteria bacterium]
AWADSHYGAGRGEFYFDGEQGSIEAMANKKQEINLTESLAELQTIVGWFETQENVDVEIGLEKVRAAAKLIKDSKTRLAQIENEFHEIEKDMQTEEDN